MAKKSKDSVPTAKSPLNSAKGVETMYRNAYRAELDMISLAAAKANIMISLNGLIISVLVVSGAFIYALSPLFLLPATLFLFTSAASVYFALLAASPEQIQWITNLKRFVKALITREAKLREAPRYLRAEDQFKDDASNVLIYEDRVKLSKEEYQEKMRALLTDPEGVYDKMNDQLYWLGQMSTAKFRMLGLSYGVFRWGMVVSVLSFISIKSLDALFILDGSSVVTLRNVGVSRFQGIYEPSAAVQLPDGRLLIVEDEKERAFNILSFRADGSLIEDPALDARITEQFGRNLSDLEGLAIDGDAYIYAITSHSVKSDGGRSPAREELVRFRIQGDRVEDVSFFSELLRQLQSSDILRDALAATADETVDFSAVNIEGLAWNSTQDSLMIGFREPLIDDKSLVITLSNPQAVFADEAAPEFTEATLLDLDGGGVRSMNFDPVLGQYVIVNEVDLGDGPPVPHLWAWSGAPDDAPVEMQLPRMIDLKNVESIDSITVNRQSRLMLSSDDGNEKDGRPASYILLEHDQLWRVDGK